MAVSRHLGFYRTANSAIRSADPENPNLEPNMKWIGCTVCEIFAFKLYCDLELGFGVTQGHRKRPKLNFHASLMASTNCKHLTESSRGVVGCLIILVGLTLSQIFYTACQWKNFENRSIFEIISKNSQLIWPRYLNVTDRQTDNLPRQFRALRSIAR